MTTCTHPTLTALGTDRCTAFKHCPTCGWENAPVGHIWVPAGLESDSLKVCAHCNDER